MSLPQKVGTENIENWESRQCIIVSITSLLPLMEDFSFPPTQGMLEEETLVVVEEMNINVVTERRITYHVQSLGRKDTLPHSSSAWPRTDEHWVSTERHDEPAYALLFFLEFVLCRI